jgi:PAS domain S-box-containing protein
MENINKGWQHEIDTKIEKLVLMTPEEYDKVGALKVQALLRELLSHLRQIERTSEELEKVSMKLDEARKEYVDLYEFAPVGYLNLDSNGVILKVNLMACDMLNIPKERLTGQPFIDLVEEYHHQTFNSFLYDISRIHSRLSTEVEMHTGDGTIFYAHLQAIPIFEKSVIVYRLSIANVTERKRTEKLLRDSEERLRNVFQSMNEGFALCEMIYDRAGNPVDYRFLEVNPAFAQQTGFSVDRVVGHTVKELIPGIENFWIETYDRVVKSGQSERILNPVAELQKHYEVNAWRSGPGRFAVVFHDVTELQKVLKGTKTDRNEEKTLI